MECNLIHYYLENLFVLLFHVKIAAGKIRSIVWTTDYWLQCPHTFGQVNKTRSPPHFVEQEFSLLFFPAFCYSLRHSYGRSHSSCKRAHCCIQNQLMLWQWKEIRHKKALCDSFVNETCTGTQLMQTFVMWSWYQIPTDWKPAFSEAALTFTKITTYSSKICSEYQITFEHKG